MDFPSISDDDLMHYQEAVAEALKLEEATRQALADNHRDDLAVGSVQISVTGNPGVKEYRITVVPGG